MNIFKTLSNVVEVVATPMENNDIFVFLPPTPNTLSNQVLNEVYIYCDTTIGPVFIMLPKVVNLGSLSPKIFITDKSGTSLTNPIFILSTTWDEMVVPDLINQSYYAVVQSNFTTTKLEVGSDNNWVATPGANGSTYNTTLYTTYPFTITPSMIASETGVVENSLNPTLQGYKIGGSLDMTGDTGYANYIGSIECLNDYGYGIAPWKLSGIFNAFSSADQGFYQTALPYGFLIDETGFNPVQVTGYIVAEPYTYTNGDFVTIYGLDLILIVQITGSAIPVSTIGGSLSFEYEFLFPIGFNNLTYIFYP